MQRIEWFIRRLIIVTFSKTEICTCISFITHLTNGRTCSSAQKHEQYQGCAEIEEVQQSGVTWSPFDFPQHCGIDKLPCQKNPSESQC